MDIVKIKKLVIQIIKFSVVGIIATLIDIIGLYILKEFFIGNVLLAAGISYCVSLMVNYLLSMRFVFEGRDDKKAKEFAVFVILSLVGLGLNQLIMWLGSEKLGIYYMAVKLFATLIVLLYNFITRKIFIEKH